MHLLRDATQYIELSKSEVAISIHASLTRCNILTKDNHISYNYFNSCISYEMQQESEDRAMFARKFQFMHRLRDATHLSGVPWSPYPYFNSCISYEMQPEMAGIKAERMRFQFMHLLRDATYNVAMYSQDQAKISIHASLTRCNCYILYFICDSPQYIVLS